MTEWTKGRRNAFIRSVLRTGSNKWPPKFRALDLAFVGKKISKSNRMAKHYKCASCGEEFTLKDINMDHIDPVVDPAVGFVDWDTYIERLFCDESNYQALCVGCHKEKTASEKRIAKEKGTSEN